MIGHRAYRRWPLPADGYSDKELVPEEGLDLLFLVFKTVFHKNLSKHVDLGLEKKKKLLFVFLFSVSFYFFLLRVSPALNLLVSRGCGVGFVGLVSVWASV